MGYRRFWLVNGDDEVYDLTDSFETNAFFAEPSNLGTENEIVTTRIGQSELVNTYMPTLLNIEGTLVFPNDRSNGKAYMKYTDFSVYCQKLPLKLYYEPPHLRGHPVYREVVLQTIEKEEVTVDQRTLMCPISFKSLTQWITGEEQKIVIDATSVGKGKKYPLKRPYAYRGDNYDNIALYNNSSSLLPMIIEIEGDVFSNPSYSLRNSDGEEYGVGGFRGDYSYMYVNSDDLYEEIVLKDTRDSIVQLPVNKQDFSIQRNSGAYFTFLYLRPGRNQISFSFTGEPVNTKITIRYPKGMYATI